MWYCQIERTRAAQSLAALDVLASLAHLAAERDYCRPRFDDTGDIEILGGRHAVIEQPELTGSTRPVHVLGRTSTMTDTGLAPSTGYGYALQACDFANNCSKSG